MMNNDFMTMDEMADIAELIINDEVVLNEDVKLELNFFMQNCQNMTDSIEKFRSMLTMLKKKNKLIYNGGDFVKAYNLAQKLSRILDGVDKDASVFVQSMNNLI